MSRPEADRISGACADGKHGRCTGWMVVPYFGLGLPELIRSSDISVKCHCEKCNHPEVDPDRHLKQQPQRPQKWNSLTTTR